MKWETLISTRNLKLAWRRINTARNLQYKRFYRDFYLVYESAIDENLRELHKKLSAKAWSPNHPRRVYLPKPSGLQRPISLLGIEDQILLQAVANSFADKLRAKRQKIELKTVFSNRLASPKDSIFFTERWQETYYAFQKKCANLFSQGYCWAAHFDLSAYYDTISHDLLIRIIASRDPNSDTWTIVKKWFRTWSAGDTSAMTGHGIPQGPVASDFIAEAFFLPIDLKLTKAGSPYLRYVDDIRLFGKTKNIVLNTAIKLEQECRHRGLIPQSAKFDIRELKSPTDAMGALPSISPSDGKDTTEPLMTAAEAMGILKSAIDGRPMKIKDKSRFRYVMYRAPADTKFLNAVLKLLPHHPEHIDAFAAYFTNFGKRRKIARDAFSLLKSGSPYFYVRGELWQIVARLGGLEELREGLPLAREDAKKRSDCMVLSWGVMHFLMRCERDGLARLGRRLVSECPTSRALLAPIFPDREFTRTGHAKTLLQGTLEEQLAAARELQRREVSLNSLGLRQKDLSSSCKNALRALGVIQRRHRTESDWIAERLTRLYGCADIRIWHMLLNTEYEHASQILIEAEARFPGPYSDWLPLQDSFNDIVVRQFFSFLKARGLPGHSKTVGGNNKHVDYGTLIQENSDFDKNHNKIATQLRLLHVRRNRLPGSHPYDKKGGKQNRWLKKRERDNLVPKLRECIDNIVSFVQTNCT